MLFGRLEADTDVAEPVGSQPVVVRARLGRQRAVSARRNQIDIALQQLLAFVAVQPEERPRQTARFHG